MYWTLDNRPPTVDEIMRQGAQRIRDAVEAAIERHDSPKIEIRCTEIHDEPEGLSAALTQRALMQNAAAMSFANQQARQLNGMTQNQYLQRQAEGFGGHNPFMGCVGAGAAFGGILGGVFWS